MKRILAVLAVLCFAGVALADCGECESKDAGTCETTCEGDQCCMESALAMLPKMTYRVSDHETCCSESAKQLAEDHSEAILYVVEDQTYESEAEAYTALADATETFVANFAEPKTCPDSGTTSLAGLSVTCSEKAEMMAGVIKEAMDTIHVSYRVGEEECDCPTRAASLVKESGEEQMYVIGDAETCCSIDARIKVARAKYKAAILALAKVEVESSEEVEATTES